MAHVILEFSYQFGKRWFWIQMCSIEQDTQCFFEGIPPKSVVEILNGFQFWTNIVLIKYVVFHAWDI
jgi:hypothetical protein